MQATTVHETVQYLQSKQSTSPVTGIILGTGLNALVDLIQEPVIISYKDIPHFPASTVEFHKGQLIFGTIEGKAVVVMQGRFHYYEGYTMQQVTYGVRVMKALGVRYLLLSNAAGGMNPAYKKGDLIITEDHINLLPDNPLRGLSAEWGNRFVDMCEPYDKAVQAALEMAFRKENTEIKKGVYVAVMGPNLETRAEYRWLKSMGADMVGMSTVPEVIAGLQGGLKCAAVSVITDECDPDHLQPVNIAEIIETAGKADKKLSRIFADVISQLS